MIARVYLDTSVIGGLLDEEFKEHSSKLFEDFAKGRYRPVLSEITTAELRGAPAPVRQLLHHEALKGYEFLELTEDAHSLANEYISRGVVGSSKINDARHIAIATLAKVDMLVSWNFKDIVKISRIHGFNSVNVFFGYQMLEIRSPLEVYYEED